MPFFFMAAPALQGTEYYFLFYSYDRNEEIYPMCLKEII